MSEIKIRTFKDADLKNVLKLNERSISTSRTADTWAGNNLTGVLAEDDSRLIGLIPLEPRRFSLGRNKVIDILWVTGAHIDKEYRSQGIGSRLDKLIDLEFSEQYKGVFVYREDESSPAYKWYHKNDYYRLVPILAYAKEVEQCIDAKSYELVEEKKDIEKWQQSMCDLFKRTYNDYGGYPERDMLFWNKKWRTHYYKDRYEYSCVILEENQKVLAYAFCGKTDIKDGIKRLDVLEWVADTNELRDRLHNACLDHASKSNLQEIRMQFSVQDPNVNWAINQGFKCRWRTNILGRFFDSAQILSDKIKTATDLSKYTIKITTPKKGVYVFGKGNDNVDVFMCDEILIQLLCNRISFKEAVEDGRIVLINYNEEFIDDMAKNFQFVKWIFFHIDYI